MVRNSTSHLSIDDPNIWAPYRYYPTKIGAIIFVIAFSLTTLFHIFQLFKRRTWYFIPLIIGGLLEVGGYIGRIVSSNDIWVLGPFIVQAILLLVAPALFAASIYIILGRIILLVNGERFSLIRQRYLTTAFVCGDILAFMTQAAGGGIQAMRTVSSASLGQNVVVAGLFLQILFFGLFIVVAVIFHYRLVKSEGRNIELNALPWRKHMWALYIGSSLIMIRSTFRVIEYLMGNDGYLLRHEVYLYIFDGLLMFAVMVLFNIVHPSEATELMINGRSPIQDHPGLGQGEVKSEEGRWTGELS